MILKRAAASRTSGEWREDDYDVVADGIMVGRIMKATAAPEGTPWFWTLAYGHRGTVGEPTATPRHAKERWRRSNAYVAGSLPGWLHRAENIGSALKRAVNVCQRQFVSSGVLLRSSFAILAARTRHRFSTLSTPAFSITSRLSNSSDIVHPPGFWGCLNTQVNLCET
jgi:hypothetical protein